MKRASDWLFGAESAAYARFVQVGFAALLGARVVLSPFRAMSGQPAVLFRPTFYLAWLDHIPSSGVILAIQLTALAGALTAIAGKGTARRVGFAVAWGGLVVLAGFRTSRGKIMHNDLLLIWAAFPFLFAATDLALRDVRRSIRAGWTVRCSILLVSAVYFFCGAAKVVSSGPKWVFSDNMSWLLRWAADSPRAPFPSVSHWVADQPVLAIGSAASILAMELTFPIVVPWARVRPLYAGTAVALHTMTWLLLGYDYWLWAAVVAVLLIDWPAVWTRRGPVRTPGDAVATDTPGDRRPAPASS